MPCHGRIIRSGVVYVHVSLPGGGKAAGKAAKGVGHVAAHS